MPTYITILMTVVTRQAEICLLHFRLALPFGILLSFTNRTNFASSA